MPRRRLSRFEEMAEIGSSSGQGPQKKKARLVFHDFVAQAFGGAPETPSRPRSPPMEIPEEPVVVEATNAAPSTSAAPDAPTAASAPEAATAPSAPSSPAPDAALSAASGVREDRAGPSEPSEGRPHLLESARADERTQGESSKGPIPWIPNMQLGADRVLTTEDRVYGNPNPAVILAMAISCALPLDMAQARKMNEEENILSCMQSSIAVSHFALNLHFLN